MGLRAFFTKVKKNLADVAATSLFAVGSMLMAASDPAVTIAITACSIVTSIYFDTTHTRDKRKLFNKLKKQLALGKDTPDPSRAMEEVRWGGTVVSVFALVGYIVCSSLNLNIAAEYVSTLVAVLSCHVGRKIYDSQLGANVRIMQAEKDSMFEMLGLDSVDQVEEYLNEIARTKENYDYVLGELDILLQAIREEKIVNIAEIQERLTKLGDIDRMTAEPLDSSARTLDSLGYAEISVDQVEAIDSERQVHEGHVSTILATEVFPKSFM